MKWRVLNGGPLPSRWVVGDNEENAPKVHVLHITHIYGVIYHMLCVLCAHILRIDCEEIARHFQTTSIDHRLITFLSLSLYLPPRNPHEDN